MKVLIVKLSSLGDIVHTLPLINEIQRYFPHAQVDWLVGKKGYEFLTLIPNINNIYLANYKNILQLQKQKYDFVIDVQGLLKSAILSKVVCGNKVIGFKNTREFAHIFYDIKVNAGNLFKTSSHIIDLNLKLLAPLINNKQSNSSNNNKINFSIPRLKDTDNKQLFKEINLRKNQVKTKPLVAIFPTTTWKSKLWPIKYWFEVISDISRSYDLYICASTQDKDYLTPLTEQLSLNNINYTDLTGETSVKDLFFLIQNSDLVIGMDSAGIHIASATNNDFGYPDVIGLYGPTSPHRSGPYNLLANCLYLSNLECIACRKKQCPLGHHNCMNDIVPNDVSKLVNQRLTRGVLNS